MIRKNLCLLLTLAGIMCFLSSCKPTKLMVDSLLYRSIRTEFAQPTQENPIPEEAKIVVGMNITMDGVVVVTIFNMTDDIMVVDNTRSYFISGGRSLSYYDPTVRTSTTTDLSQQTKGMSVNLGSIAGALGVGGGLGRALNGVNVGGSGTSGTAVSNTTYIADQQQLSIGPRGSAQMAHNYSIAKFNDLAPVNQNYTYKTSPVRFSVCISYSLDNGATYQKLVTTAFLNSMYNIPVTNNQISTAYNQLLNQKPDAYAEDWWFFKVNNNLGSFRNYDKIGDISKVLFDYQ